MTYSRMFYLILFLFFTSNIVEGQSVYFTNAEKLFEKGEYFSAAKLYEKFISKKADTTSSLSFKPYYVHQSENNISSKDQFAEKKALWKLAESLRLINDFNHAEKYYRLCMEKYGDAFPLSPYWYGVCLRANKNYSLSEEVLTDFVAAYPQDDIHKANAVQELQNLAFTKSLLQNRNKKLYEVTRITRQSNQESGHFAAHLIGTDFIAFTSTYTDSLSLKKNINPYHNRLFEASLASDQLDNVHPVIFEGMNTLEQGAASYFPGGNKMFFTQWENKDGKVNASIYYAEKQNNAWSAPVKVERINIAGYNSMQPFITADGKYVFFSTDKPGGSGNYDLWYAAIKNNAEVDEPVNAGKEINTIRDEKSAFYSVNEHKLVFSTNGRTGLGGYDLFAASGDIGRWKEPVNMGFPFNSSKDDLYFFETETGGKTRYSFLSSDRASDCCLELYKVDQVKRVKTYKGRLLDCKEATTLENGKVYLIGQDNMLIDSVFTSLSGTFQFDLTEDDKFAIRATRIDYTDSTLNIEMSESIMDEFENDSMQINSICLVRKKGSESIDTNTDKLIDKPVSIYFDFDKHELRPESKKLLDSLIKIFVRSSSSVVEIGGFTDIKGDEKYNLDLGYKRSKSVADYFMDAGVPANRLRLKSYGECCPVTGSLERKDMNEQEADQLNRRVQFVFLPETTH